MKMNGESLTQENNLARKTCLLPRYGKDPLQVTVRAMPLTWNRKVLALLPDISPPEKMMTKPNSDVLLLDSDRNPIRYTDYNDADYLFNDHVRMQRMNAWMLYECIVLGEQDSWENPKPANAEKDNEVLKQWLDRLVHELEDSGFSQGDTGLIISDCRKLSNLTFEDVESERDRFLLKLREQQQSATHSRKEQEEPSITPSSDSAKE